MKIAVVTGSRSEYGILRPVIDALRADAFFMVEVVATGSHLAAEFGMTVREIEADGVPVQHRVDMQLSGDTGVAVAKATGRAVIGFADVLAEIAPDWVVVLGDRYEILAVAQACLMLGIPLAHIGGGDLTEGSIDDAMRHAITKMAHLHFPTHADAASVIVQMGEDPSRVHCVGNPALDAIVDTQPPTLQEMRDAGYAVAADDLLVILHPETVADATEAGGAEHLARVTTQALESFRPSSAVWLILPNADANGRVLAEALKQWAEGKPWVHVYASLPHSWFRGLMAHCRAMVGNSSAALCEAPSFGLPAVNIGSRQAGRLAGPSVVHVPASTGAIVTGLRQAMAMKGGEFPNPYGDGRTSPRILRVLKSATPPRNWLRKRFHRLKTS
jgi:UDP-hydrolysing UDP-N-acetyl-D-glucosamine 2-epimerase